MTLGANGHDMLTDAWLDAAFAATREARIQRAVSAGQGREVRRRVMLLTGGDIAQLRWMLRVRAAAVHGDHGVPWSIELRNTRSRVATLHVHESRYVCVDGDSEGWGELRDGETLARWFDARGFHAPFEAWKLDRGSVRSRS